MTQITPRTLCALVAAACCVQVAWAQPYPNKAVRIIVPFGAGGPADIYARFLGQRLQESLGQSFVVDDRPGAGSIIGTDLVAKSPPDGYTLLMMSNTHTVNETLVSKKPFTLMKDFVPVAPVNYSDLLLVVHPSLPVKSVKELVQLAKSKPRGLNYASSGTGTPYHMAGELFKALAGVDIVHVPHKGSGEARTSVMSGQVEMMLDAITVMAQMAKAGRVRALGTSGAKRSTVMPEVPTIAESGYPGYEATNWYAYVAPSKTPKDVLARWNQELVKVLAAPEVREQLLSHGLEPMPGTAEALAKYIEREYATWGRVVKEAKITAN